MLKPDVLQRIMAYLVKVPQLQTIRVHSRVPIAKPLQSYQFPWTAYSTLNKILVIHCNHPSEISTQTAKVCQDLAQQGVRLYSQTVLLKGINDRIKILSQLYHALWQIGVQPYYLHLLDRVQGAAHFEVSALRAKRLYTVMQHYLPGYLIPKLVREEHRGKRYLSNY